MFDNIKSCLIEEKMALLRNFRLNNKNLRELEETIVNTRLDWLKKNSEYLINKIEGKNFHDDLKRVHYLIFNLWLSERFCNPKDNDSSVLYSKKGDAKIIEIKSRNFCSYLEAFKLFGFDNDKCSIMCGKILEKPIQIMIDSYLKKIGSESKIIFNRNYDRLRPKEDYCLERLSLVE